MWAGPALLARLWRDACPAPVAPLILIRRGGSKDADNQVVGVEILQLSLRAPSLEPGKLVFETTPPPAASRNARVPARLWGRAPVLTVAPVEGDAA